MGFSTTVPISYQNGRLIGFYDGEKTLHFVNTIHPQNNSPMFTRSQRGLSIIEASYTGMTFIGADYSCVSSTVRDCPITFTINPIIGSASGIQFYEQPYNENFKLPGFYFSADGRYLVGNTPRQSDTGLEYPNRETHLLNPRWTAKSSASISAQTINWWSQPEMMRRLASMILAWEKKSTGSAILTDPVYFAKFVADGQEILNLHE